MNKSKAKGTSWETSIVNYLVARLFRARRKTLSGSEDKGDIELLEYPWLVIEAKNERKYDLSTWVGEAEVEARNSAGGEGIGIVWAHRNGKSDPGDGYVIMTGATFTRLLSRVKVG